MLGISDRVMVIAQGRKTATLNTADTSQVEIMQYAVAAKAASHPSASPVGLQ